MSGKCEKASCLFCNASSWEGDIVILKTGLQHCAPFLRSYYRDLCVCGACDVNIRQALKARDKGEPYQLRWLKSRRVCYVPFCTSADIKAEKLLESCM